jgi:hypothetical protein
VAGYAQAIRELGESRGSGVGDVRRLVGSAFTRGHFARAV